ncbi:GNAT family N-acetyltransferase [Nocardia farcinica]|uniref:GNAT family N-acetyltransferase n=1 Tax=Nocardia farcinica TaxID=37329 RepID=UPI0024584101|nr:GNAT family N-acetyltransferase [Nocardia farcinica]
MPKSKGRKPKKRSVSSRRASPRLAAVPAAVTELAVGAYRVRPARTPEELSGFERWASMAGAGGPKVAQNLVRAHGDGFLGAGLRDPDTSYRMMVSSLFGGDLDAVLWARTDALVATLDGHVVGGAMIGPAAQFISEVGEVHSLGTTAVMQVMLFTSKLHLVAVDDDHRRHGLGRALVRAAAAAAYRGGVKILYGQFLTENRGLAEFYGRQGFTVMPPATPLNFSQWLDGFPGGPAPLENETFFYRTLATDSYPLIR